MYYLSESNEKYLQPFLHILRKSEGIVELQSPVPSVLISILRSAANTRYPELKGWRYKLKETKVIAIPKNPYIESTQVVVESIDYIGIVNTVLSNNPTSILFSNYELSEDELKMLEVFSSNQGYTFTKDDRGIKLNK